MKKTEIVYTCFGGMMMKKARRQYTREFKLEALHLNNEEIHTMTVENPRRVLTV
jgi:predicted metal-dependent phosphotriesterase family hydrolase